MLLQLLIFNFFKPHLCDAYLTCFLKVKLVIVKVLCREFCKCSVLLLLICYFFSISSIGYYQTCRYQGVKGIDVSKMMLGVWVC